MEKPIQTIWKYQSVSVYRFALSENTKFLAEAGPYLSVGLWGKNKVYTGVKKVEEHNDAFSIY